MGRTQAGKSTLLEALTGGDGARIGDGRQRFSRDVYSRRIADLQVELIDTPGVGALDGQADYERAFGAVQGADLILWVAATDPTQEQTARALQQLAALGKPIIVALNCRFDLTHEFAYLDFLEEPGIAFREVDDHFAMLDEHLNRMGAQPVTKLAIHAQAAFLARCGNRPRSESATLETLSGVNRLLATLERERRSLALQRRIIRDVDAVRTPILEALTGVGSAHAALLAAIAAEEKRASDLRGRSLRAIDAELENLEAAVADAISFRRSWHLHVDLDGEVADAWKREVQELSGELEKLFGDAHARLVQRLDHIAKDVDAEWAHAPTGGLGDDEVPSFSNVWVNRALKVGLALAPALILLAPVQVPAVALAAVGFGLSRLSRPVAGWIDTVIHGEAEVLRRRRERIERWTAETLDGLASSSEKSLADSRKAWTDRILESHAVLSTELCRLQLVLSEWASCGQELDEVRSELDSATAKAILRSHGHFRAADSVQRATRLQGVATVVELSEPAFTEVALCLVGPTVEPLTATPANASAPAVDALRVIMGLCSSPLGLRRPSAARTTITILEDQVTAGIRQAWGDIAQAHLRHPVLVTDPQQEGLS
ncbi:GTPase domain-containing protein [Geodermatophilus sp. SYSU D01176]